MIHRRAILSLPAVLLPTGRGVSAERWQGLPATPAPVPEARAGRAAIDGIDLFYLEAGPADPSVPSVLLLHGGLANADYLGHQMRALMTRYRVIAVDSRGHGRSTTEARALSYDLMTEDVVALMDHLRVAQAHVVGWSDGAIIGLDLARHHPARIGRLFAFAGNTRMDGVRPGVAQNPVFARYIARCRTEYRLNSPTPGGFDALLKHLDAMWAREPNWSDRQLRAIRTPVLVAHAQHDEAIKLTHSQSMAATIPGAELLVLPAVSHFAFLQDPALFNRAVLDFLGG